MRRTWDRARVMAALSALKDNGISVPKMARKAGATRSTIYRWMAGEVQPEYGKVYNLAYGTWLQHPELARDLVEASGYAWAEPAETPEPEPDPLAEHFGEKDAARLRRVLGKRGEAGAIVLAELEREFSSPAAEPAPGESEQPRAAS